MTWQILLFQNYVVIVMGTFLEFFRNYPSVHFSSHFFQIPVTRDKRNSTGRVTDEPQDNEKETLSLRK